MAAADVLAALLDLVRTAAREGTTEALASRSEGLAAERSALLDKRDVAHALGVSTATIDRLCRQQRIPFVLVGEVRRFDLAAVRGALAEQRPVAQASAGTADRRVAPGAIRLLSREPRR
jgi:excisionase family DNA binding protein